MYKWEVVKICNGYQTWRQTAPLEVGEIMHSGVGEARGYFDTRAEAESFADKLNAAERALQDGRKGHEA